MTLHEILLGMIEDKKDIADLENEVRRLEDQHGVETYAELLYILANIKIGPLQAPALWKSACQHLHTLSQSLGRPVNITVALLDYLLINEEGEYINRAKVIDVLDYERMAQSAIRDGFTRVFNAGYIREQVSWELTKDQRYRRGGTVILFDLNKFKQCNDEYGHMAGDAVLREFALVLKEYTRQADVVGRYGGDEFLVLMPMTHHEGALIVADRIRHAFEKTVVHVPSGPPEGIRITTTGGIAEYMGEIGEAEVLIEAADQALYLAKREGANRVYHEYMVKTDPVLIPHDDMVDMRVLDTVEEPVKTIGKRPFKFIATDHMDSGRLLRCELTLNDEDQNLTLSGLITEANPQNDGGFEIVFHPVEQESGDWLAINQYILKFERTHQKE
jgi:diguanylate cyclase (GGDEF)-like protein